MKQEVTITIEIPDGYDFVRYDFVQKGESYCNGLQKPWIWEWEEPSSFRHYIVKKRPPRTRLFMCISEEPRVAERGEYIEGNAGDDLMIQHLVAPNILYYTNKYKIFKEVN